MVAKNSAIQIEEFVILNTTYKYSDRPADPDTDLDELFNSYVVDIDYHFRMQNSKLFVFALLSINHNIEDYKPGYQIFVEGGAVVPSKLLENLSDEEMVNKIRIPALNLLISYIRGYILNMTSYAPMGKYTLPVIDLLDLIQTKSKLVEEKKTQKQVSKK